MTKCRKSFGPECEYFVMGGCVSPFNCSYKAENESITTATGAPFNLYPLETDKDKEIARLTAENQRLREEAAEQKSIAEHEHAAQMDWFEIACDYKAENAELRARLEKAVELPCEMGDTIYEICKACDAPCECKYYTCEYPEGATCHAPSLPYGYSSGVCVSTEIVNDECKKHFYVEEWKFNLRFLNAKTGELKPQYFIDREAAEARFKELLRQSRTNGGELRADFENMDSKR